MVAVIPVVVCVMSFHDTPSSNYPGSLYTAIAHAGCTSIPVVIPDRETAP
jgi:hypothetical protein